MNSLASSCDLNRTPAGGRAGGDEWYPPGPYSFLLLLWKPELRWRRGNVSFSSWVSFTCTHSKVNITGHFVKNEINTGDSQDEVEKTMDRKSKEFSEFSECWFKILVPPCGDFLFLFFWPMPRGFRISVPPTRN